MHRISRSAYADKLREFAEFVFDETRAFQQRGKWRYYFEHRIGTSFNGKIVFEIGCFDAAYLSKLALNFPGTGFVGLDWKCRPLYLGAQRIAELDQRNIVLVNGRAQQVDQIFAEAEIDEAWLLHPDPCAKPNELPNRLFGPTFLNKIHRCLRDRSLLCLKTDHPEYYQWAMSYFDKLASCTLPEANEALQSRFEITANSTDFWNDAVVLEHTCDRLFTDKPTHFEARYIARRLPIYYLELLKKDNRFSILT